MRVGVVRPLNNGQVAIEIDDWRGEKTLIAPSIIAPEAGGDTDDISLLVEGVVPTGSNTGIVPA